MYAYVNTARLITVVTNLITRAHLSVRAGFYGSACLPANSSNSSKQHIQQSNFSYLLEIALIA